MRSFISFFFRASIFGFELYSLKVSVYLFHVFKEATVYVTFSLFCSIFLCFTLKNSNCVFFILLNSVSFFQLDVSFSAISAEAQRSLCIVCVVNELMFRHDLLFLRVKDMKKIQQEEYKIFFLRMKELV